MLFGVVRRSVANHSSDDFQPTMSQTAQRTGMALSFISVGLVIGRCPGAIMAAEVRPQVQSGPQPMNASPPDLHPFDLPAFEGHRRGARAGLNLADQAPVNSRQFDQQPRRQLGSSSGQRTEQLMIGMLLKQS